MLQRFSFVLQIEADLPILIQLIIPNIGINAQKLIRLEELEALVMKTRQDVDVREGGSGNVRTSVFLFLLP